MFLHDQGCLLRKEATGERHLLLVFFLKGNGLQIVLTRKPSKQGPGSGLPDLFDSGEVIIEKKGDKPAFLKEFIAGKSRSGLARSYKALQAAARLALFMEKNLLHMEHFEASWDLLHNALDSLGNRQQSSTVLLKAFYIMARTEGYPVRESWIGKLPAGDRREILQLIQQPVDSIEIDESRIRHWVSVLEKFLQDETDLLIPG
ncbi:MAG: hypothetical protein ACO3ZW_01570 [Opitutales bacterium]|jgi:recombinational DNA repair protein (RecF pathway)